MTNQELSKAVETYREYKILIEEAEKIKKEAEAQIISYLEENNTDSTVTDNARITYKNRTRTTLDKEKLIEALGSELLSDYMKTSTFKTLLVQ